MKNYSMKNIKIYYWIIFILSLILPFIITMHITSRVNQNNQVVSNFKYNIYNEGYEQKLPLEKMDFYRYRSDFDSISNSYDLDEDDRQIDYILTKDLNYYTNNNGKKVVAYTIPKGTCVYWSGNTLGYGISSYPTYEKGWRYVKPFVIPDEKDKFDNLNFYYVKIKDLEYIALSFLNSKDAYQNILINRDILEKEYLLLTIKYIDKNFYNHGVCCSQDLLVELWNQEDILLLCIFILLIVTDTIFYTKANKLTKVFNDKV